MFHCLDPGLSYDLRLNGLMKIELCHGCFLLQYISTLSGQGQRILYKERVFQSKGFYIIWSYISCEAAKGIWADTA